ncbi:hypothetical protein L2E82_14648 [Cichorium intybus]|uniref:Uncharacterized protein n=1 Tax=Cichorium intybus TaxID=13427 RepID=A0ACB9F1V6_CICIN|nr:hypothetical protein L2E82_14648 [Cichorium intybus]
MVSGTHKLLSMLSWHTSRSKRSRRASFNRILSLGRPDRRRSSKVLMTVESSSLGKSSIGTRMVTTKGFRLSDGLEWKISRVRTAAAGEERRGMSNRSFQTGLVELESSDFVARQRSRLSQKMVYGFRPQLSI